MLDWPLYIIILINLMMVVLFQTIIRAMTKVSIKRAALISWALAILSFCITLLGVEYGRPASIFRKGLLTHNDMAIISAPLLVLVLLFLVFHGHNIIKHQSVSESAVRMDMQLIGPYLNPKYLALISLIVFFGTAGLGLPVIVMAVYTVLLFLVFPVWQWMRQDIHRFSATDFESHEKDISSEREKVLSMVENGKVTAEDATLLINALETSARPQPRSQKGLLAGWRILTVGAFICVLGIVLLPWFYFGRRAVQMSNQPMMAQQMKNLFADFLDIRGGSALIYVRQLDGFKIVLTLLLTLFVPVVFFGLGKWINARVTLTIAAMLLIGAMISLFTTAGVPFLTPTFGIYTTAAGLLLMGWGIFEAWKELQT